MCAWLFQYGGLIKFAMAEETGGNQVLQTEKEAGEKNEINLCR
jgi:hypothetical protein